MSAPGTRHVALTAHASLLVVAVTVIALLGGLHPSDHARDRALTIAAVLFALLSLPTVVAIARRRVAPASATLALLARVAVAALALRFVHGISHEHRHDAWRACRARISLGGPQRCAFLHLCANEAPLSAAERALLLRRIRGTPGCADP
jgi:hypothetical protein